MRKRLTSIFLLIILVFTSADFTVLATEQSAEIEIVETRPKREENIEENEEIAQESITEIRTESVSNENNMVFSSQDMEENIQIRETVQEDCWAENIESTVINQTEEIIETEVNFESGVILENNTEEIFESQTESATEIIFDDSKLKVTSSNSFGKLLTKSMEEEILELEQTPENNISSITIDGRQATVEFGCVEDAILVVAIYDESGIKMLASGKIEVTIQQVRATVTIDVEHMPDYFLAKAYLIGMDALKPLSSVYETPMYTREMQELLKKTTDDFDTEKVINLDENKDNNFVVADDDTKVISNIDGENIISEFDSDMQVCVITHANEEITTLQVDDLFVYEYEENEILVIKIASIIVEEQLDGTKTATIQGEETTLEEAFAYLKIDTESELDKAQINASETVDGVEYQGLFHDNNSRALIDKDDSISWSVKFTFLDEKSEDSDDKLTGDVSLGIDFKTKIYLSLSYYYVEIKCDYKVEVGLTISSKSEYIKKELLKTPIGISPVAGVYIEFMPSFVIEASAKISVKGKIKGTFGYAFSKDEGIKNISSGPSAEIEVKGEVELFVGISLEPKVKILSDKIAKTSMDVTAGGVISAKTDPYKDEGSTIHECRSCLDGDISARISLKADAELNIIKKIKVTSPKLEKTYKFMDFYYSFDFDEFAFTVCPHHKYLIKATVLDKNGKPVTNACVEDGVNQTSYLVDDNGMANFYLPAGKFTLKAYLVEDKSVTVEKNISIVDRPKDIKIVLEGYEVFEGVKYVQIVDDTTAAVMEDGRLYTWGCNGMGALGNGSTQHTNIPVNILNNIDNIKLSLWTSSAISKDKKLYIWKYNGKKEEENYGVSHLLFYNKPILLADNVKSVNGVWSLKVTTNDGDLLTWYHDDETNDADYDKPPVKLFENVNSSVGEGIITKNNELFFKSVKIADNVADYKESDIFVLDSDIEITYGFLTIDGTLYLFGNNVYGQLCNGVSGYGEGSANPIKVIDNIVDFGVGPSCWGLDAKGTLYVWGYNKYGELGTGDNENRSIPTKVLENVKEVYGNDSYDNTAVILQNDDLYVWGNNRNGCLGIGTNAESCNKPTKILENVKTASIRLDRGAAITNDNKLYMWGDNSSGQIGDGTQTTRYSPVKVMDNVKMVCLGEFSDATAAITNDGELYMWGDNNYGQLGNGTNISSSTPVKVVFPSALSNAKSGDKLGVNNSNVYFANELETNINDDESTDVNLFQNAIYGDGINGKVVFNDLDAGEIYNIYEIKSKDAEDILYSENLLYIAQTTADQNGSIAYPYEPREVYTNSVLFAVSRKAVGSNPSMDDSDVLQEDVPADGVVPEGLWIAGIFDYSYTGEAIKPEMRVYDSKKILVEKTDYTVSYKNNVNAGKATITVTGKGNYSGKETATFNILPADLSGDDFSMEAFYVKTGKKAQSPVPVIYYMGTKLKHKKDFTITYSNTSGVYATVGEYSATITGMGNYTGTREIKLTAVAKIAKTPSVSIAKASLAGFEKSFSYTGKAHKQECTLSVKTPEGEKTLTEGVDYTVRYTNNTKAGTAAVIYSGKNGYTGKLKKTYKIMPYNIMYDAESKLNYENFFECAYAKGGSKPKPVITYDGRKLAEGADYTLSYKNNKAVYGKRMPSVIVNGKGNFKGKLELYFTINPQDLSKMTLVSCDKVYQKKAGIYRITPKLMDLDGKLLSAGKDFDKNDLTYIYETAVTLENGVTKQAGDTVEDSDIIPAGTQIRVTFGSGTGDNYTGTFTGVYRIVKADMKSAKVTIPNQTYTGKEITLDKSQITVTLSGTRLKPEDYDIIQYTDNVKKGKAAVTIKGTGNYGGTKTVKFTIGAKGFLWWKKKN